jgi:hypothetical protein
MNIDYDFENQIVIKNNKPFPFMCLSDNEQKYIRKLIEEKQKSDDEQYRILLQDCPF